MRQGPQSHRETRPPNSPQACLRGPEAMPTLAMYPLSTDTPQGIPEGYCSPFWGLLICIFCGVGPLPCSQRVNPLPGPIEPLSHPCLVTVTVAELRCLFLLPKITMVARKEAEIPGSMQSGGGEPLGGSPPGSPAGCTGTRVAHPQSCTTCRTWALWAGPLGDPSWSFLLSPGPHAGGSREQSLRVEGWTLSKLILPQNQSGA